MLINCTRIDAPDALDAQPGAAAVDDDHEEDNEMKLL